MNKLTKSSLATGAGLVLLLGGTGTFMSWNAEATAKGGTITAGHLTVNASAPTWTVNGTTEYTTAALTTEYRAAPGDTITYEAPVAVSVEGDSLKAILDVEGGDLSGTEEIAAAFGASSVQVQLVPTVEDAAYFGTATDGTYTLSEGSGHATAAVTMTFANGAPGAENTSMGDALTLGDLRVTLTQADSTV